MAVFIREHRRHKSYFSCGGSEHNAFTCNHCNGIVVPRTEAQYLAAGMDPRTIEFGFCLRCMKPICIGCDAEAKRTGVCKPFVDERLPGIEKMNALFAKLMLEWGNPLDNPIKVRTDRETALFERKIADIKKQHDAA
jgi:hypothetical protein